MGHWPIHRRCANKLGAYGVLPLLLVKLLYRPYLRSHAYNFFIHRIKRLEMTVPVISDILATRVKYRWKRREIHARTV